MATVPTSAPTGDGMGGRTVECPRCLSTGTATARLNLCATCGGWFHRRGGGVVPLSDDEADWIRSLGWG